MTGYYKTLFLFVFLLASGSARGQAIEPVETSLSLAFQEALDEEFSAQITTGFTAAVSMPDGRLWQGTAGMSNPDTDDLFRTDHRIAFASITKTFVAALVLQLVDEDVLTLEDTIADWLPPMMYINSSVTIQQLLNHQSGIYNFTNHPNLVPEAIGEPDRSWVPEELLASFLGQAVFTPGVGSGYSNTNYILLGMIAKAATGIDVSVQFRTRFLDPHQLNATYLGSEEESTGELATTWFDLDSNGSLDNYSSLYNAPSFNSLRWTAGGMYSTAEEIARWAKILFTGGLLDSDTQQNMLTFLPISGTGAIWTGYGLGIQEYQMAGATFWGHSGGTRGAVSLMAYSPEYDISIAVAANDNRASQVPLVSALFEEARASLLVTSSEKEGSLPKHTLSIKSIYPNPFQQQVTLTYQLAEPSSVEIIIHDLLGREVDNYVHTRQVPGDHLFQWNGTSASGQPVPPGLYMYTIKSDKQRISGSLIYRS